MNLFLYIIWNNAYYKKQEIIDDIRSSFKIHKIMEIYWTPKKFADNLSRFYGRKLSPNSFKEKACGIGPFTLIIFEDEHPLYEMRKTSRGNEERVNIHTFDKKTLYRSWTSQGVRKHSKIHGTNTPEETEHDLTLLLGTSPKDFLKKKNEISTELKQDIIGSTGWKSLEDMFYVLNHTCRYVVMRNFEGLPNSIPLNAHTDIDLLTDDFDDIVLLCNAKKVFQKKYRVQCLCEIGNKPIQFDFRFVGDGYYDLNWEKSILDNRKMFNGIYVPNDRDHKYMLLYHVLMHKRLIAEDYKIKLTNMFGETQWDRLELEDFLTQYNYNYTEPADLSVYFNFTGLNIAISKNRKIKTYLVNFKKKILGD